MAKVKKMKCIYYNCKNKVHTAYCEEHYRKDERGRFIANHIYGMVICFLIGVILMAPYLIFNVDEGAFCKDKISTYFPEYKLGGAVLSNSGQSPSCIATIINPNISMYTRDGLLVVDGNSTYDKEFLLTNQKDIDYVDSDNDWGFLLCVGLIVWIIFFFIAKDYMEYLYLKRLKNEKE